MKVDQHVKFLSGKTVGAREPNRTSRFTLSAASLRASVL
jgi:hypothetical protein